MSKPIIIYRLNVNGKFYVGATKTPGMKSKWFQQAEKSAKRERLSEMEVDMLRAGREKVYVKVLEVLPDEEAVSARLDYWISKFDCHRPHGYNAVKVTP